MNRKHGTLLLLFLPLAVLMVVSAGAIYRDYRQQRLNQDLIATLKNGDVAAEIRSLNAGADANARDRGDRRVTVWGVLRDYWQRLRTGKPANRAFHTPAILVFISRYRSSNPPPPPNEKDWIAQIVPLLDRGASINSQDEDGTTPLLMACSWDCSGLARLLIDRGADVNVPDYEGYSPLACSLINRNLGQVRMLLKAGAKVNQKYGRGYTPLVAARHALIFRTLEKDKSGMKTYQDILRLLQQAGAHE